MNFLYSLFFFFLLGACTDDNWVTKANEAIMSRMEKYGASELHFSLMALTKDRIELYQEQMEEVDGMLLSLPDDATEERRRLDEDRNLLAHKLQLEKEKRARWHVSFSLSFTKLMDGLRWNLKGISIF